MPKAATIQYHRSVVFRLQEYIDAHMECDITPELLSDHVYVSKDHLAVLFSQVQQESIGKYIKRCRIERAATLMNYTGKSLDQVAAMVGYSGKHALSKAVYQHFGQSPGRFRKKLHYLKDSPNIIMDEIRSETEYNSLINTNFNFHYRVEALHDHYTFCRPLRMVPAFARIGFSYENYQQSVAQEFDTFFPNGRFVVRPFDSLNFTSAADFNMHHGLLLHQQQVDQLTDNLRKQYFLSPVKNGKYLVLDIPAGEPDAQIKRYTTLFRENLIGRQRAFDLDDFCSFLLPGCNSGTVGQFYMYWKG